MNGDKGKVMSLLLHERGDDIKITDVVVRTAAANI